MDILHVTRRSERTSENATRLVRYETWFLRDMRHDSWNMIWDMTSATMRYETRFLRQWDMSHDFCDMPCLIFQESHVAEIMSHISLSQKSCLISYFKSRVACRRNHVSYLTRRVARHSSCAIRRLFVSRLFVYKTSLCLSSLCLPSLHLSCLMSHISCLMSLCLSSLLTPLFVSRLLVARHMTAHTWSMTNKKGDMAAEPCDLT